MRVGGVTHSTKELKGGGKMLCILFGLVQQPGTGLGVGGSALIIPLAAIRFVIAVFVFIFVSHKN